MNGPQDVREQMTKRQKRRENRLSKQQNSGKTIKDEGGKTKDEGGKTIKDEGGKTQTGMNLKKQGQQAGGKKRGKEKGLKLVKENVIKELPVPGPRHLAALSKLLISISTDYGMSKADLDLRWKVFNDIKDLFEQKIKGSSLRLYGSSSSCLGLKTSDLNIEVHEENEEKIPRIFITFLKVLKGCKQYCEIKEDFESTWPVINFKDVYSGLTCRVSTGNSAFLTNSLLRIYGELDWRVKPLCHGFRLWAKICRVDHQAAGTLPPYSFFLMVIHYLQQTEPPVLPIINEKFGDDLTKYFEKDESSLFEDVQKVWKTANNSSLGELWLGLLRLYCNYEENEKYIINIRQKKKLVKSEKSWAKNKFGIEDPFSTKRNVARTLLKNNAYRYIVEHIKVALVYFSHHPDSPSITGTHLKENEGNNNPGQLSGGKNVHETNALKGKIDEVKDQHENCVHEDEVKYEHENGDDDEVDGEAGDEDGEAGDEDGKAGDEDGEADDADHDKADLLDGIFAMDTINDSVISEDDCADTTATDQSLLNDSSCPDEIVESANIDLVVCDKVSPDANDCRTSSYELPNFNWERAEYLFDDSVLCKADALDTKCSYCGEDGHIVDNCTAEQVTRTLKPLPHAPDWWFKEVLTKVCYCCKDDFGISEYDVKRRHFFLRALETYITKFLPDAKLHLFGSSCNGFGFTGSDMDLCMTLDGKTKDDVDCIKMVTWLAGILRKNPECAEVIAITGAKVPIVKFFLRHAKIEADISMYNEVALWNTRLLAAYVRIDNRVHILGCTLKIFVKLCDIGDASKGSLSSYAYVLMLLHFLQQRQPPVLPVLQELYDTPEQPQRIIEGHNCWFYDDLNNLDTKWAARNKESCGELWLGFLRYYTEDFDYRRNVVCVRYLKPLTKFEKLWNGRQICIEDPFVLSHNLGAALSLGMVKFIRSTFEKARERFGTARRDLPVNTQERQRFFFDPLFLNSGGMPPTGRNCNVCGKIGHWAKECPFNRSKRDKPGKGQQNKTEKIQQKAEGQQNKVQKTTENGPQQKAENAPQNKAEKGPQKKVETTTPQNEAAKGPQGKCEVNQQSKGEGNQASTVEQYQKIEEQKEKLDKKNVEEDTEKVLQIPVVPEAAANNSTKLGDTPGQQIFTSVQPRQTIIPQPLPRQGHFPQPHAPMQLCFPPRTWNYQPLSPPISPRNPMAMMPKRPLIGAPIPSPTQMSNVLAALPRPTLPRQHLAYQQHGLGRGNIIPGSAPIQHSSPITTPISPLVRPHPSSPMSIIHQPMFSEVAPPMGTIPSTPPQSGTVPIPQFFGNPGSPFAFNFFPGDHNIFLNRSPPLYQPFGSPPQQGPGYPHLNPVPMIRENSLTQTPRVILCEDLEKGYGHVPSMERDQTDGAPGTSINDARSIKTVEEGPIPNVAPSVLDGLRSLNINDMHTSAEGAAQDQNAESKEEKRECGTAAAMESTGVDKTPSNEKTNQEFQPPPIVQNIARIPPDLSEKEVANQGEAFAFSAEYSEENPRKNSRNRRRQKKQKVELFEGAKDDEKHKENAPPLKDFLAEISRQQQPSEKEIKEGKKPETSPHSQVTPQRTQRQQINKQQQMLKKTPDGHGNKQQPRSVQNAQKQLQELQRGEQEKKRQNTTRQEKANKSPTHPMQANPELQQKNWNQQQTQSQQKKPRQLKIQYTNKRQAPSSNSFPQQSNPFNPQQAKHDVSPQSKQKNQQVQHQPQKHHVKQGNDSAHQGGSHHNIKSPQGRQAKQAQNASVKGRIDPLVVNVNADGREVSFNGQQNMAADNTNDSSRNRRRRRKPRNGTNQNKEWP